MQRIGALLAFAIAGVIALSSQARSDEHLLVNVFPGPQHLALYVAKDKGLFAKRGLSVDVEFTPTSKAQRDALADGRVQIAQAAVDNAVAMVEGAKKDVIIVSGGSNGMLSLFVRPEVKSYDDIRGKAVVVDAPDTAYALVLYKMLALKGVKRSEYDIFQGGDCMRRLNGIRNDPKNVAVLLNFPCTVLAEREGFPNWGSAADALGAYQADGAFVMRDWAQQHRDALVNYLQSIVEALAVVVASGKPGRDCGDRCEISQGCAGCGGKKCRGRAWSARRARQGCPAQYRWLPQFASVARRDDWRTAGYEARKVSRSFILRPCRRGLALRRTRP